MRLPIFYKAKDYITMIPKLNHLFHFMFYLLLISGVTETRKNVLSPNIQLHMMSRTNLIMKEKFKDLVTDNYITESIYAKEKDSEITMQVGATKNITFFVNRTTFRIEVSQLWMTFKSSEFGVVQDIEIVANMENNRSTIDVPLHSMLSGKTQFYLESVNVREMFASNNSLAIEINNHSISFPRAVINVSVYKSNKLIDASKTIGWIYFFAWSLSFYPQIYENWKRKSVIGLNFDFLVLNTVGYWCYTAYNFGMFSSKIVQGEYRLAEGTIVIPVQSNDLAFSSHGIFACLITVLQCIVFRRGEQKISKICWFILAGIGIYLIVILACKSFGVFLWLDCLTYVSYIKIFVTVVKYIPQAYMNYRRKSTTGWSILLVLLAILVYYKMLVINFPL